MNAVAKGRLYRSSLRAQLPSRLRQALGTPPTPAVLPPLSTRFSTRYIIGIVCCALAVMAWRMTRA